jgi:uncharacterized protein YdeI (YjbR/CyaY-like superfamily)
MVAPMLVRRIGAMLCNLPKALAGNIPANYKHMNDAPHFYATDRTTWRQWLMDNHDSMAAVWLVYDKGPGRTLSWADIVQESLCFGWIDSRPGKVSDTQSKLYICKRKPKSVWSKINKAHIDVLMANGSMQPAGLAAIERAKLNGSWDALNNSDNLILPPQLAALFDHHPTARANFESFSVSTKRNTLQWIYDAKTDATRANRITQTVESAERNERLR